MGYEPGYSAFGDIVTAAPYTLIDAIPLYGLDPDIMGEETAGSGSVVSNLDCSCIELVVTAGATDTARIRSHENYRYQAGKGGRVIQTGWLEQAVPANQVRRWGQFDDNDGLFFEARSDGELYAVIRSSTSGSPVDTAYDLALDAPFDLTKSHIYALEYQWLGVGEVTFIIDGVGRLSVKHPNVVTAPYMKTAFLPVSAEVVNSGASGAGQLNMICNHVRSEGGQVPPQKVFAARNSAAATPGGTLTPILSIRLADLFKTVENRALAYPHALSASVQGSGSQRMEIDFYLNPTTLTGPSWTAVDSESALEWDEDATAVAGGTLLATYTTASSEEAVALRLDEIFSTLRRSLKQKAFGAGSDVVVIAARALSGSPDILAAISWGEVH